MYFSNIGLPFTGERQPLRPQRRPAPLAQGSQGAPAGGQRIFRILDALSRGNDNPSGRSSGQLPLHRGAKGAPAGGQRIFRISGFLSRGNGNPSGRSGGQLPLHRGAKGLLRGDSVFFEYRASFHRERQPLRPQRRPAPLTQGSQGGSCGGFSVFFEYWMPFRGGTATPQAAAAASSPCTGAPRGVSCGGTAYFSSIGRPFTGGTATPQAAAAATPLAQGSQVEYTPAIRYKKGFPAVNRWEPFSSI